METILFSETSVQIHAILCYIPEDGNFSNYQCEELNSCIIFLHLYFHRCDKSAAINVKRILFSEKKFLVWLNQFRNFGSCKYIYMSVGSRKEIRTFEQLSGYQLLNQISSSQVFTQLLIATGTKLFNKKSMYLNKNVQNNGYWNIWIINGRKNKIYENFANSSYLKYWTMN